MKVSELIEILKTCDQDDLVIISRDAEGNGYEPLRVWDGEMRYNENEKEVGFRELTSELKKSGYSEEDIMEDGENCVVFWP